MVGFDTNVMLRILTAPTDSPGKNLAHRARAAAVAAGTIYLSEVVLGEIESVLCRHYKMARAQIIAAMDKIFTNPQIEMQDRTLAAAAWRDYKAHSGVGLADCLILRRSRASAPDFVTFDKKLARLPGATLA